MDDPVGIIWLPQGRHVCPGSGKAHYPDIDPTKLAGGFPQFKLDNSEFGGKDLTAITKETRYAATVIVEGLSLDKFQYGYDKKSRRIDTPNPRPAVLIPPQQVPGQVQSPAITGTCTPAIAPPCRPVITEDDPKNQGLALICWTTPAQEIGGPQGTTEGEPVAEGEAPKTQEQPSKTPAANDPTNEAES